MAEYQEKVKKAGHVAADEEAKIYEKIYSERMHEEKEIFVTEASALRKLFIARDEFITPLKNVMTSEEFRDTFEFLEEFIKFRSSMFTLLHPKK